MTRFVVIRADATPLLGAGHVVRCSRIANALMRFGWRCAFAVSSETPATAPILAADKYETVIVSGQDEPAALEAKWPEGCDLLLVDHYGRDAEFERACRPWAKRIVAIEDLADRSHDIDLMIYPGAINRSQNLPDNRIYLGGPAFAALHPAFAAHRKQAATKQRHTQPGRIVISFGGGDVDAITTSVAEALVETMPSLTLDIVLGTAGTDRDACLRRLGRLGKQINIHCGNGAPQMATLMAQADIAIGAAGGTSWERCCLSLPSIVAVIAENQRGNAALLRDAGGASIIDIVDCQSLSNAARDIATTAQLMIENTPHRAAMAKAAGNICDGLGARRIAAIIDVDAHTPDGKKVWLRPVDDGDTDIIFNWQSEPGARIFAHDPKPPEAESHRRWMEMRLGDPDCLFSIVMCGENPAGMVRLDGRETPGNTDFRFLVSILIPSRFHRQGLGLAALAMARRLIPESEILAEILPANQASIGLFKRAGYRQTGNISYVIPPMPSPDNRPRLPA